jgi:hypothetical protein
VVGRRGEKRLIKGIERDIQITGSRAPRTESRIVNVERGQHLQASVASARQVQASVAHKRDTSAPHSQEEGVEEDEGRQVHQEQVRI